MVMRGRVGEERARRCLPRRLWVLRGFPRGERRDRGHRRHGLHGARCLPPDIIAALGLPFVGRGAAVLADGRLVETRYHRGRVLWHPRERGVKVLATAGGPLVGMALLRGSRLTVEVAPAGDVVVEELARGAVHCGADHGRDRAPRARDLRFLALPRSRWTPDIRTTSSTGTSSAPEAFSQGETLAEYRRDGKRP